MSVVQAVSLTVTHVDVLHIAQQIKRDLQEFRRIYPKLIDADRVLDLHDAMVTFLSNDAVTRIGFSIVDSAQQNLVLHELRYEISYSGIGPRVGVGGARIDAIHVPGTANMMPWVAWSPTMMALSSIEQSRIVQGTGWPVPGNGTFNGRYEGTWSSRGLYSSGALAAESQEFRGR